ncbi:nucleotidyltransferase domain-containing protein [Mesorhizobium sp.]|uniref:nucleotidyltransferase domain-containing protein n=1 Tax=Mesorhizobium sp. TaxID=1871066 RepID=UPI000FE41E44|nr:nucleotidyltransferase domain-containing protein [Mesorhizobium sp.]RWN99381.1 MAG: nucleotidyltransferase domain-containing protein [Mesorhizobium sp.]TIM37620.1 MAG: nucleotidyltransferase domain-containing protein [Mesorhizobium sp.]
MTSKQLAGLLVWLDEQREIVERAWIFGSRFSGQRREKDTSNGPDVDLAVELRISSDGKLWLHELRHRLREFLDKNGASLDLSSNEGEANFVHLEFCIEGWTVTSYVAEGATLIYPSKESKSLPP